MKKTNSNELFGRKSWPDDRTARFSTVFSTGVENFGERPNVHEITAAGWPEKEADSNTLRAD